jgi:NAD-reducing hydrogenase small subunit
MGERASASEPAGRDLEGQRKARLATVWLGGCSGCHMSFLDLDEWLFDLAGRAELVFSPIMDAKKYPTDVDIVLVEGAVTNSDNLEMAHDLRANSKVVVSFGDCAVTGNVTSLRNKFGDPAAMLQRVFVDAPDHGVLPDAVGVLPTLLPQAQPLHQVIDVDVYIPGCPPSADRIKTAVQQLLDGDGERRYGIRFG